MLSQPASPRFAVSAAQIDLGQYLQPVDGETVVTLWVNHGESTQGAAAKNPSGCATGWADAALKGGGFLRGEDLPTGEFRMIGNTGRLP